MNKFLKIFSALVIIFSLQSCSNDDEVYDMEEQTISAKIISSMNYTYLAYALQKTNLSSVLNGTDKYTLMAPSNMAFRAFLMNNGFNTIDEVPENLLKQVLLNHVLKNELEYRDIETGYYKTVAISEASLVPLSIYINQVNMRVTLNGEARITPMFFIKH